MSFGGQVERGSLIVGSRLGLPSIFVLTVILFFGTTCAFPQTSSRIDNLQKATKKSAFFQEVETLLQQGRIDEAKAKIQAELDQNPASVDAYDLLGVVYADQKNYDGAQAAFEHALKLDANSVKARNDLGNVYIAQGKDELAEKEFRAVLRLDPANRDANYNLGLVLLAKGSPADAIVHFQRVRPLNVETRFHLTRAYLRAGRTTEGLKTATELSAQNKDDVQLHFTLGVLLASEKQYKAAQLELEKANALQPETFEILFNLGETYLRTGDYLKAELALNRALKIKPDSPEALYVLAQTYFEEKKSVDALDILVRAHKMAPQNPDIIFLLARVSMTQNYFEDAIPLLESGIKAAPQRADLHAALGESYFMSGKTEKAIDEFKTLISVEPSAPSYAFMGLAYRHLGQFDEARKYFEAGLKQDPRNVSCLFNVGFIEERQGNHAKAEQLFEQVLRTNPDHAEALLELANLRTANKKYLEAAELLRRYVKVSREPAAGYYKLAMVERSLHQLDAAQRDLSVFQTLSKDAPTGSYPYQHLFDFVDNRSTLSQKEQTQLDLAQLVDEVNKHPEQPQNLYLLAEAYLKLGKFDEARKTIEQLDALSSGDYRTQTGIGVLLARYRQYDDAVAHFQAALRANAESDDVKFDLADAYFRKRSYPQALDAAQQVSEQGQKDGAFLALLGDIYAHMGDSAKASDAFQQAIGRNPDNDQNYLSLTLVQLRNGDVKGAGETLQRGMTRIPGSGKILWGLGLVSVLEGKTPEAAQQFERSVDLLPEWPGSYSTLGVFYYETGEIAKAREVLNRFKGSSASGILDISRIEDALSRAPATVSTLNQPMPMVARQQLLQLALTVADRTL